MNFFVFFITSPGIFSRLPSEKKYPLINTNSGMKNELYSMILANIFTVVHVCASKSITIPNADNIINVLFDLLPTCFSLILFPIHIHFYKNREKLTFLPMLSVMNFHCPAHQPGTNTLYYSLPYYSVRNNRAPHIDKMP